MKNFYIPGICIIACIFSIVQQADAQCSADEPTGQNLVQNPGFEMGDTLFTNEGLSSWNDPSNGIPCTNPDPTTCDRFYSFPGEYWVHGNPNEFNPEGGFAGSPHTGDKMLLVDADCTPGGVVWEQTVEVSPNSNYYFSVFIATIKPQYPARLSFQVNDVELGTEVNAPDHTGEWLFYEDTWNSGNLSGEVQLRIIEQSGVGCDDGDDFALDDINFIKGCRYGSDGPTPDLGPDRTFCGTSGEIVLDPGVPDHPDVNINWSTGETTPTITITEPGTYSVCVDSAGSCLKSDIVTIAEDYELDLGGQTDFCSETSVTLDASFGGDYVTYQWKKDGEYIRDERESSLWVNEPGIYEVEVRDPVCGLKTDSYTITSSTTVPENAEFCPPASVELSVSGSGNYAWYDAAEGGNLLGTGTSFTTPTLNSTTTYYVEDTTLNSGAVGPATVFQEGFGNSENSDKWIEFETYARVILDEVTVYPVWVQDTMDVGVTIYDITNGLPGTEIAATTEQVILDNNTENPVQGFAIPLDVELERGRKYRITNEGTDNGQLFYHQDENETSGLPSWPYVIEDAIALTGLSPTEEEDENNYLYGYFYDWQVRYGTNCSRVPVRAKEFCEPECEKPETVLLEPEGPLDICGGSIELTATPDPAAISYNYEFVWDNAPPEGPEEHLQGPGTENTYEVEEAGFYRVYVTDPAAAPDDIEACTFPSYWVKFENSGLTGNITDLSGPSDTCRNIAVTYTISSVDNALTYTWEIPDDASIISSSGDTTVQVLLGETAGYVKVTPSNSCSTGEADSIYVSVDEELDPAGEITAPDTYCEGSTVSVSIASQSAAEGYTWEIPEDFNIVADYGNSLELEMNVDSGYVKVFPYNDCGPGAADSVLIEVTPLPGDATSVSGKELICDQGTYTYTAEGATYATSFTWEFPAGVTPVSGTTGRSVDVTFDNSEGYIKVTPENICATGNPDSIQTTMVLPPDDAGPVNGTQDLCEGDTVTYTTSAVTNADEYTWRFPEGSEIISTTGTTITLVMSASGSVVGVTPENQCGSGDSYALDVDVTPLRTPEISISDPGPVCEGRTVSLSASTSYTGGMPAYEWYVNGDPQNNNTTSLPAMQFVPGDHISVGMTSTARCTTTDTANGSLIIGDIGAVIEGDTTACHPDSVLLIGHGIGDYKWYQAPDTDLNHSNDSIYIDETGHYFLEVSYDICRDTASRQVIIYDPKVAAAAVDTNIIIGKSTEIFAVPVGYPPFSYSWTGSKETNDSLFVVSPMKIGGGQAEYYLEMTDSTGCKAYDTLVVSITDKLLIPNLITPNDDGYNDTFEVVGILPGSNLIIYNRWGDKVYESDNYQNDWDPSSVSDGIYYWHLEMGYTGDKYKGWVHILSQTD